MNAFDIAVIVILSFCLIRGIFNGLIGEVSGIIGVFAGFYGAFTYYPLLSVYGEKIITAPDTRNLAAFFVLFCSIFIIVNVISLVIRKILHFVFLGWFDRVMGFLFGAAKGLSLASVLFIMITTFLPGSSVLTGSKFSPYVASVSKAMTVVVSKNTRNDFLNQLEAVQKKWKI